MILPENQTNDTLIQVEYNESMRVEWIRAKARMDCYYEEKQLLYAEMERILLFLQWRANWWLNQVSKRTDTTDDIKSGLSAYAHKQSNMFLNL